ncbi:MAG: NAD(P)/FAD-dependent oxidoreductase [Verrucomicrobiaceae bacterium]|nr:NAD(P)/FAD-dependent oxidoreductase [Verrucomicrobiaceae bacterium]
MNTSDYDVVILGGAFSGSTTGILLKRQQPELRILIVEKSTQFDRKVGESTSEVAGCFLTRTLGLEAHLSREQITKHGLRMWFNRDNNQCPSRCSEIGPYYQVRLPTYQLDRCRLDSHLLKNAEDLGCEVWRPASVKELNLSGVGNNTLIVKHDGVEQQICSKWVVDATGKAAFLARKLGHLRKLDSHKTSAIWARFKNVTDLDNPDLKERFPEFADAVRCPRSQATNHLMGHGWWSWIIPLKNGEVSAGLTYDSELFTPPEGNTLTQRLHAHLLSHPIGKEMFSGAVPVEKDTRSYSGLAYYSTKPADEGWICVGDAAGFIDPLYSQGLDYCAHSVSFAAKIIAKSHDGECIKADVTDYAEQFVTSYLRWYHALYRGKYRYLGDAELMNAAFWLDIGTYFIGPVRLVHDDPCNEFPRFPYYGTPGKIFANFMRFYNQRLGKIGERRYASGKYGQANLDKRYLIHEGFAPCKKAAFKVILKGVFKWLRIEVRSLFLPRLSKKASGLSSPTQAVEQELTTDH